MATPPELLAAGRGGTVPHQRELEIRRRTMGRVPLPRGGSHYPQPERLEAGVATGLLTPCEYVWSSVSEREREREHEHERGHEREHKRERDVSSVT